MLQDAYFKKRILQNYEEYKRVGNVTEQNNISPQKIENKYKIQLFLGGRRLTQKNLSFRRKQQKKHSKTKKRNNKLRRTKKRNKLTKKLFKN